VILVFGVHWSADHVGSITTLVAAFVATVGVGPQVTAVVAPDGSRRPRQSLYARGRNVALTAVFDHPN